MSDQQPPASPAGSADWAALRRQMPITGRWAFFDHAAVAPLPQVTVDALAAWCTDMSLRTEQNWGRWDQAVEQTRTAAAALLGADRSEVALIPNTTWGINLVAEAFPWQHGDNVVTLASEFPSNLFPWLNLARRGVEARVLPTDCGRIDLAEIHAACDARTRIVAVSWVDFATGWRHDLDALADVTHQAGALLLVDAIQGLGVFPLDLRQTPIDFLVADGHKWLLGPEGAGLLFLRAVHLARLAPLGVGWHSVRHTGDYTAVPFDLKASADRYEGGTPNTGGFVALGASLALLGSYGPERIGPRVIEFTDLACERLLSLGAQIATHRVGEHRSGIVAFDLPGRDLKRLRGRALAVGVALSYRVGRLRISPHAYNDTDDLDRLIDVLKAP